MKTYFGHPKPCPTERWYLPMAYRYLLDLALILLSTKVLGIFSQRFRMPQVVGALVAGLILGPAALGVLSLTDFLHTTASLGVIVLMFTSGMETDLNDLKRCGKSAFLVALIGVLLPLAVSYTHLTLPTN